MDGITNRLFPTPQYASGLLGDEYNIALQQARQQGLLGLAAGLLQAGGPSRQRIDIGQAIGAGLQSGQQAYRGALQEQIQGQQMALKMQEMQRLQQQQRALQQAMPTLVTTEREQALTTGAQAADPLAALIKSAEAGTLNQPVLNQEALSKISALLPPKDFKDLMSALETRVNIARGPKPEFREVGGALYNVSGGAPRLAVPATEKPTGLSGEYANLAISKFGTADLKQLTPDQLGQLDTIVQQQRAAVAAAGRPSVDVKVGETTSALLLKNAVERTEQSQARADAAAQTLRTTATLRPLIEEGVFSGPLSSQAAVVSRLGSALGVTGQNTQEILNRTAEAMQGLARLELQSAESMRGQGAITENERSLIARAAGGDLSKFTSPEIKTLLNALDKTSQFTLTSHQQQVERLKRILPEEARGYADVYTTNYEIPKPSPIQSGRSRW